MSLRPIRLSRFSSRVFAFAAGGVAVVWLLLTGIGVATATILTRQISPAYARTLDISAKMAQSEKYLLPPDPKVSAEDAGAIFHRVSYAGAGADELKAQRIRPVSEGLEYQAPDGRVSAPDLERVRQNAIASELLERIPPNVDLTQVYPRVHAATTLPDGTDLIARLASARRLDLLGARLPDHLPAQISYFELPIPRMSAVREMAQVRVVETARAIAEHRLTDAERLSRELITIAFVWHREAPTLIEILFAGVVHDMGIHALAATAEARGDVALAAELRGVRNAVAEPHRLLGKPRNWTDRVTALRTRRLLDIAQDPELPRAIAVEEAAAYLLIRPCYVYPLVSVRTPLTETLRPHIVHYASESAWYDKLAQPQPSRSILDWPQKAYDCAKLITQVVM